MQQYLALMQNIINCGVDKSDRTGTGTRSLFGYQMRFDLQRGFPLLTTKKLHLKSIIHELLWFLQGDTNIKYLQDNGVHIWDEWADENGDLGPVYGKQWRSWRAAGEPYTDSDTLNATVTIDQITNLINTLKNNPDSRRMLVTAWNPAEVDAMALPPCHCLFQFYTRPASFEQRLELFKKKYPDAIVTNSSDDDFLEEVMNREGIPARFLDCQLYQRSADVFLGVPFNIASYALFTMMVAQVCGYAHGEFIHTLGDAHLYNNHREQVKLQLSRAIDVRALPAMWINPEVKDIFGFKYEDFRLDGYDPHPSISAPVAV